MPNRVVREGIIKSELVNQLSLGAEVFYRRLMSLADDFGRYDGRSSVLRADLYALRIDRVSLEDIGEWKLECERAGLIRLYGVQGKEFLEVKNFNQRLRSMKSKYPAPEMAVICQPIAVNGGQPQADDSSCRLESEAEAEVESEVEGEGETAPSNFFDAGWMQYPRADMALELTAIEISGSIEWIFRLRQVMLTELRINDFWKAFCLKLSGKKFYAHRSDLVQHFREWLKTQKLETVASAAPNGKPGMTAREKRDKEQYEKEFGKKAAG